MGGLLVGAVTGRIASFVMVVLQTLDLRVRDERVKYRGGNFLRNEKVAPQFTLA